MAQYFINGNVMNQDIKIHETLIFLYIVKMWPFKKKKTREEKLAEVVAKVAEILKWMQKNECYPPKILNDLKGIMNECVRIQKEIEEQKEWEARYQWHPQ